MQIHHIPQEVRTSPPGRYRYAIKLDLLVQERDLLRCTIVDSAIPLFPHPPVLSRNALANGEIERDGRVGKRKQFINNAALNISLMYFGYGPVFSGATDFFAFFSIASQCARNYWWQHQNHQRTHTFAAWKRKRKSAWRRFICRKSIYLEYELTHVGNSFIYRSRGAFEAI